MNTKSELEVQGIVQRHPVPELLVEISELGIDGSLRIFDRERKTVVYFEGGEIPFAVSNAKEHRLFSLLLEEGKIDEQELGRIEDYVNDFRLAAELSGKGILADADADRCFRVQVARILQDLMDWKTGNWTFSPLARLKGGLRYGTDIRSSLFKWARGLTEFEVQSRFKSYDEMFSLNPDATEITVNFEPKEAFVLSRVEKDPLTVGQLKALSGLEDNAVMPVLYRLWLGGFVTRENWNKAFNKETAEKLRGARVRIAKTARSVEEELRLKEEAAKKAAAEDARKERERQALEKKAEERRARERKERAAGYEEVELSVEQYLDLVENAPTLYTMFGIGPDAETATIKSAYFSYARRFHPDVFHKNVEPELHKKIQSAFTEIAQAYETLRHKESREVYDLKVEKVLESLRAQDGTDLSSLTKDDVAQEDRTRSARESFERGSELLEDGHHEEAVRYLGRAVHMDEQNAEFRAVYGLALSKEKKNRHKAENELQAAVALAPSESRYRLMLAELYVEIGLSVRARNELGRILEMDPGNRRAADLIGQLKKG